MITRLLKKRGPMVFDRRLAAPITTVWEAWTRPELVQQWWGVEHTTVPDCDIDLRVGGRIFVVMEAGEGMGKYAGTRWPMEGTFTRIEAPHTLVYDAQSWTEGEDGSTIAHTTTLTLREDGDATHIELRIDITDIASSAKMAAIGMKWGYTHFLDTLETWLADR